MVNLSSKSLKAILIFVGLSGLMVVFQNCSEGQFYIHPNDDGLFSSKDLSSLGDGIGVPCRDCDTNKNEPPAAESVPSQTPGATSNTNSSATSGASSTPGIASNTNSSPSPNSGANSNGSAVGDQNNTNNGTIASAPPAGACSPYEKLKWTQDEAVQVDLNMAVAGFPKTTNPEPSYLAFSFSFSSDREPIPEFKSERFSVYPNAFLIRIEDLSSNMKIDIPYAVHSGYLASNETMPSGFVSYSKNSSSGKGMSFTYSPNITRAYYLQVLSKFKKSKISMFCNNKLIASGIQDLGTLMSSFNNFNIKASASSYTMKVPMRTGGKVICLKKENNNIECRNYSPRIETNMLRERYWIVDGNKISVPNNVFEATHTMEGASKGKHYFQEIFIYKGGEEIRSNIQLVNIH